MGNGEAYSRLRQGNTPHLLRDCIRALKRSATRQLRHCDQVLLVLCGYKTTRYDVSP